MKTRLLFICTLLAFTLSAYSQVELAPSSMVARLQKGKISIDFCELGKCSPLGKKEGYSPLEWKQIDRTCRSQALYIQPGKSILQTVISMGAAMAPGKTKIIALAGLLLTSGDDMGEESTAAYRRMRGVRSRFHFTLTLDEFVDLRNGIKFCAQKYDKAVKDIEQADLCSQYWATPSMGCSRY